MSPSKDSINTEQLPGDTTSRTVEPKDPPPRFIRLQEMARDQLEDALDTDTPSVKNHHIREALQALVITTEHRPGDD